MTRGVFIMNKEITLNTVTNNISINKETIMIKMKEECTKNELVSQIADLLLANIDENDHVIYYNLADHMLIYLDVCLERLTGFHNTASYKNDLHSYFEAIIKYMEKHNSEEIDLAFFRYMALQDTHIDYAPLYLFMAHHYSRSLIFCPYFYRLLATMILIYPWSDSKEDFDVLYDIYSVLARYFRNPDAHMDPVEREYMENYVRKNLED